MTASSSAAAKPVRIKGFRARLLLIPCRSSRSSRKQQTGIRGGGSGRSCLDFELRRTRRRSAQNGVEPNAHEPSGCNRGIDEAIQAFIEDDLALQRRLAG